MSTVDSRLLMIGPWPPPLVERWGAAQATSLQSLNSRFENNRLDVIVIPVTNILEKKFDSLYKSWKLLNPYLQIITVVSKEVPLATLHELNSRYQFKNILKSYNETDLENAILSTLSLSQESQQREQLSFLQSEQAKQLESLQNELESRVEKRARFLSETRRKLFVSHERMESFQRLLMQLPSAQSLLDLEKMVNDNLSRTLDLQWIKIVPRPDDELFLQEVRKQVDYQVHRLFLYDRNEKQGSIFLMASEPRAFTKDENEFLQQIAEAISLTLDAIRELEKLSMIKKQWEKTFESLSEPLLLIDKQYNVVQSNQPGAVLKKCYELLFQRAEPCQGCLLGSVFQIQNKNRTWEVRGQKIDENFYAHFYRDITENLEMQRRMLETSRLVEMGTISSSLAHELNNPLAGLLTFAQMLKMDLDQSNPIRPDIEEIEKAVLKCRDIVQNLLLYARDPGLDPIEKVDLVELMKKFVKILEIPSRTKGLKIKPLLSDKPIFCETRQTWLLSVWKSLALWAVQSLEEARRIEPSVRNEIIISLSESAQEIQWNLEVDFDLTDQHSPLPVISSFEKILAELQGALTLERVHGRSSRAKISFPRDSRPARKP